MKDILTLYGQLLSSVDVWFAGCIARFGTEIACTTGCSACCRGLFDITLLDAWYLRVGFDKLDENTRVTVSKKAEQRLSCIRSIQPDFSTPYILNHYQETDWERIMPDDDETPCVLLDDKGQCLVYEHRPMTCRLHGIPLIDIGGEVIDEALCTRNSLAASLSLPQIRYDFKTLFADESTIFRLFTLQLLKQQINELDTVIPAALVAGFQEFDWRAWVGSLYLKKGCLTVS